MTYNRDTILAMMRGEEPPPESVSWDVFRAVWNDMQVAEASLAFEKATVAEQRLDLFRFSERIDALRREAATAWAILGLLSVFRRRGQLTVELKRNRVECMSCGDVIESMARHHFVKCRCGNVALDGGNAYWRVVYKGPWRRVHADGTFGEVREAQKATEVL
mgnify:CR=1 FL=1